MTFRCPRCLTQVGLEHQIDGVAQCPQCEHVFESSDGVPVTAPSKRAVSEVLRDAPEVDAPGDANLSVEQLPAPPLSVRVVSHGQGLEVVLRWWDDLNIGGILLQALLVLMGLSAAVTGSGATSVVGGGMALVLGYSLLTAFLNRTTVLVGTDGIDVSHGPLPNVNPNQTVSRRSLRFLTVDAVVHRSRRGGQWTTYRLLCSGADKPLLKQWNRGETVRYVRDIVQHVYGYDAY